MQAGGLDPVDASGDWLASIFRVLILAVSKSIEHRQHQ